MFSQKCGSKESDSAELYEKNNKKKPIKKPFSVVAATQIQS